jgi:hypothetical protein
MYFDYWVDFVFVSLDVMWGDFVFVFLTVFYLFFFAFFFFFFFFYESTVHVIQTLLRSN